MSTWAQEQQARELRSRERILFTPSRAGSTGVCLAYPNRYPVAMGNLGFHAVYRILATTPDHWCERAFLPAAGSPDAPLATLETTRPVSDFDVLALSISFETDYLNLPELFARARLPLRARARDGSHPLVIAGGSAVFLNPEPIADFVDVFLVGEAEEMLPEFLVVLDEARRRDLSREDLLDTLAGTRGAYVPRRHEPQYEGPRLLGWAGPGGAPRVERRLVDDLDRFSTTTEIVADDVTFGDMFLVEASRGCQWGCRFCAAGFMYRPLRTRSPGSLAADALRGLEHRSTIGIVGAEIASLPGVAALCDKISEAGGRSSPASLKADCISPSLAAALGRNRSRTVTIAPEAGSERMRRVINKNLREAEILAAADMLVGEGVESLKLYFMVGLPAEEDADVDAIADLTGKIRDRFMGRGRERGRIGSITLSINNFVPKPWTPFQWDPMVTVPVAKAKLARIREVLRRTPNVEVEGESPREAFLQTFLSRGDRRAARWIEEIHRQGGAWWQALRRGAAGARANEGLVDPAYFVHRSYGFDETLPWDFIDHHLNKLYLWTERRRAFAERETPPCDVSTCKVCSAC